MQTFSTKKQYKTPAVKVVEFTVEQGFAGSPQELRAMNGVESIAPREKYGRIDASNAQGSTWTPFE